MKFRIKPITRLSIIFILAIVLSGSILTYFSINNISNLKELIEKRIIEEQRELYAEFSAALQNKLDIITTGLENGEDQPGVIKDSLLNRSLESDYIIQTFILNKTGKFVYPRFERIPEGFQIPLFSERFRTTYIEGEKAEFAEKDFRVAENYYLACLQNSTGSKDSVKALNALGRVAIKQNDERNAFSFYKLIVSDYFSESDAYGYPYVYYAMPQLLKITGVDNSEELASLIRFSLEQMNFGLIPLNYSTGDLLSAITDWLKEAAPISAEQLSHVNRLIESLDKQIQFVNIYGDELKEITEQSNQNSYYSTDNDFKIINSYSGDNHEFFLVNTDLYYTGGFLINLNNLFDTLVTEDLREGFDFNYVIEFPDDYILEDNNQSLVYSSQLNPYFPGQLIRIRLADEDLINDIVKRRSWIYGIASLLLLVAMVLGVALILRDIAREKHLARMRADFISNVTHELKTPLTSIRMYAESIMMGRVKSQTVRNDYLSVVVNESERLKRMINNILEFSKMEKRKQEYHPFKTNLSDILHKAISDMNYWLEEKGFKLKTDIDRDIAVEVDPEKFHQVYTNLLSNAIKYSGESKIISIRLFRNSKEVITEFEDKGIGIAIEHMEKIFEEFYRVERPESGDITGTGLGLTVAKEIVEAHGGEIYAESELGRGSKFIVRIPFVGD